MQPINALKNRPSLVWDQSLAQIGAFKMSKLPDTVNLFSFEPNGSSYQRG